MSNDPDQVIGADGMLEPHDCDRCGHRYDEASGDGYAGLCPACADDDDDEEEEEPEGWTCFLCDYRTPAMTLVDRDVYDAHVEEHGRRLREARAVAEAARR